MTKVFIFWPRVLIICILITVILNGVALAAPPDLGNLKTYNFDIQGQKQTYSTGKSVMTFFVYFLLFIIISLLAFFTTKLIASFQIKTRLKSKYMEVIDMLPLGSNKGIYLIKTPHGILLMGVSEKNIFYVSKLNDEETSIINEIEKVNSGTVNKTFANHLEYFLKNLTREPGKRNNGDGL